jgi:superfamily II DNA or RNA helicase
MTLRRHQAAMQSLAREIAAGKPITKIHAEVTPGGGKSMLPPILANELIGRGFDSVVWVVPRDSLRYQGEADFSRVSPHPFRAAGNVGDPFRGCRGYVTTYQSIAANPQVHYDALRFEKTAIFLDEPHHVSHGSLWHRSLMPIVEKAKLLVLASGTFARDDGKKIAFYDDESDAATITYSRSMALEDGAILPVEFKYLGGEAEWMDGRVRRDEARAALLAGYRGRRALHRPADFLCARPLGRGRF